MYNRTFTEGASMIEEIDSSKLNLMTGEYGVWFRSGEGLDFSAFYNAHDVTYFEINSGRGHLSGGVERALRFGRVKKEHGERSVGFKRSDLIEYEAEIPQVTIDEAIDFISKCEFELKIKEGILEFLSSRGRVRTGLHSDTPYESFLKGEREHKVPHINQNYKKRILSVALTCFFLALVLWTYSLLNISHYENNCQNGDALSCQRLILIEMVRGNRERVAALEDLERSALNIGESARLKEQCDGENFEACLTLYQAGDTTLGETRILEWACKGANDSYCLDHALSYLKGKDLPLDADSLSKVRSVLSRSKKFEGLIQDIERATGDNQCASGDQCFQAGKRLESHGLFNLSYVLYKSSCDYEDERGCVSFAEKKDQMGESKEANQIYKKICLTKKTPIACYKAAFAKFGDQADRYSLKDAYDRCQAGSENYCMFLYDRVK